MSRSTASGFSKVIRGHKVLPGFGVVAVLGVVMLAVTVRMIKRYD